MWTSPYDENALTFKCSLPISSSSKPCNPQMISLTYCDSGRNTHTLSGSCHNVGLKDLGETTNAKCLHLSYEVVMY